MRNLGTNFHQRFLNFRPVRAVENWPASATEPGCRCQRSRMTANKYQRLLLKAYPAVELLGLDLEDPKAVTDAVHSPDGIG